ncbi:MAG: PQQ-binding-like beta-propeller repeat protein, partial [Verrucomicrobiota bacterium]
MLKKILVAPLFLFTLQTLTVVRAETGLRWSIELPERQTMWQHVRDMQRDTAYRPSAAGDLVFIGCEHNGALLALEAETGEERWRYYTDGAIRTQPAADPNRVWVGSDDGFVYALDHKGRLEWKAPVGHGRRYLIGHQRLTSSWPVPTHPLLSAGRLYLLGGCWPADGVYMNAFDAGTGARLWTSPSMHMRAMLIPHWIDEGHVYVRTYSGTGGRAMRFDAETGLAGPWPKGTETRKPEPVTVPGTKDLAGSNASGGLLFGSGKDGTVYCAGPDLGRPAVHHARAVGPAAGDTAGARAIVKAAGVDAGYALVVGLKDGSVVEGLLRHSDLYVVAIDADAARLDRIRRALDARGCFDTHRLSMFAMELEPDVLPPYFADLVLSETGARPDEVALLSRRPYGGASVFRDGGTWRAEKRGPLDGAGDWSHEYANAAMNNSTADTLVKAPLGILWYGGPAGDRAYYLPGSRPAGALIVEGRMFLQGNGVIAAIDAYSGRLLWDADIPKMHIYNGTHSGGGTLKQSTPWDDRKASDKGVPPTQRCRATGFNWAAASDCLYLFAAGQCLRFDPATGESLPAWKMPDLPEGDDTLCWGVPRIVGDVIVATAFRPADMHDARIGRGGNGGDWSSDRMPMSHLFALNRTSGELLWSKPARFSFSNRAFVAGNGRVFVTDLYQTDAVVAFLENGRRIPAADPMLRVFDLKTGEDVWTRKLDRLVKYISYIEKDDVLLVPNRYGRHWSREKGWFHPGLSALEARKKSNRPNGVFRGFRGRTGEPLWEIGERHYDGPFSVIGGLILNRYGTAFDPATGKMAERQSPLTGEAETFGFKKSGCAVLGGCETLVSWRTAYHDMTTATTTPLPGFEAGCTTSLLPAGGLLNLPNFGMFHLRARAAAVSMAHRP